jgi:hypothetical protein
MLSLGMGEKHKLLDKIVSVIVPDSVKGNYAFGYINEINDAFVVKYVGRSDSDLKKEIKQQMKTHRAKGCTHFKYSIAKSVKEAFEKECKNYHDFGESECLYNDIHPAKPAGTEYKCPVEGCEYNK